MIAAALHPAARRRIEAQMPPEAPHEVELRPLGGGNGRRVIVTSTAQSFLDALFETLRGPGWSAGLDAMRRRRFDDDDRLQLGLPMHGTFQIALFEAVCRAPGSPRLDPAKIASQGLVLRRLGPTGVEGWMKAGSKIAGWQRTAERDDPDPARRGGGGLANAAARTLVAGGAPHMPAAEDVLPLFVAPPDLCKARGRTILFAPVPVVSSERSDGPAEPLDYAALPQEDRTLLFDHLSGYLKARPPTDLPYAGQLLDPRVNALADKHTEGETQARYRVALFLQQVVVELGGLGSEPAAKRLMALLARISLPLVGGGAIDAASFVRDAAPIMLDAAPNDAGVVMPASWPRVEAAMEEQIFTAALNCLSSRHAALSAAPGKLDGRDDLYQVRGFIRVRGHDGCPDRLVWSPPSEPFRILPWWDGAAPPVRIPLPDPSQLGKVRPSVSFEIPPRLANLLGHDLSNIKDNPPPSDLSNPQLGWLCSFSIPIITLCAFIVLNIFLGLFDLVFRWMMLLKICIPIPMRRS